jgi:hypothetical protein
MTILNLQHRSKKDDPKQAERLKKENSNAVNVYEIIKETEKEVLEKRNIATK